MPSRNNQRSGGFHDVHGPEVRPVQLLHRHRRHHGARRRRPSRRDDRAVLLVGVAGPPLVCFCPARTSATWPRIEAAGAFAVNILAADQEELCRRFAVTGGDKFAGVPWRAGGNGAPVLGGVLASVECDLEGVLDGGDHAIVLGRVTGLTAHRGGPPLLHFRRSYGSLPSSPSPSSSLMSSSIFAARSRSEA
ncbi:flavin reductase family protein [Streptomyces sp. 147326]|uniref:flavin reductase family protein n=1 Tax=Streptomyces sp. 147326 TaxID=3074379 RepID=UPI003857EED6